MCAFASFGKIALVKEVLVFIGFYHTNNKLNVGIKQQTLPVIHHLSICGFNQLVGV